MFPTVEIEFADKRNKTTVPIRMESSYVVEGWLNFLLGGRAEFNLCDPDLYDDELSKFFSTVEAIAGSAKED